MFQSLVCTYRSDTGQGTIVKKFTSGMYPQIFSSCASLMITYAVLLLPTKSSSSVSIASHPVYPYRLVSSRFFIFPTHDT